MSMDIEKTTYHERDGKIWRIDSGTDYAGVWDLDVWEKHAEKYIPESEHEARITRDIAENGVEVVEADFGDRGYKLFKDGEEFELLFYKETNEEREPSASYIDEIWEREIDTMLTETAKSKLNQWIRLKNSDDEYDNRIAGGV